MNLIAFREVASLEPVKIPSFEGIFNFENIKAFKVEMSNVSHSHLKNQFRIYDVLRETLSLAMI